MSRVSKILFNGIHPSPAFLLTLLKYGVRSIAIMLFTYCTVCP
jgi:hypothetical protein